MFNYMRKNSGVFFAMSLIVIALGLGIFVFSSFRSSQKKLALDLQHLKERAPHLTLTQCAEDNILWYQNCTAMTQMCDEMASRRMKICVLNGSSQERQCKKFSETIYGYNFGFKECQPYLKQRSIKKVCADSYQVIADFCKSVRKSTSNKN